MKPSLHLKVSQSLAMTPQLQQAIRLLQLSSLELSQAIQEVLESNPLLELEEGGQEDHSESDMASEIPAESDFSDFEGAGLAELPGELSDNINDHSAALIATASDHSSADADSSAVDTQWDDFEPSYIMSDSSAGSSSASTNSDASFLDINSAPETLSDHLLWQLNLTPFSKLDTLIGMTIIESLDESGYLTSSLDDILEVVVSQASAIPECTEIELDEVLAVLHRLQHFDPPGVCARSLQECLSIQLRQLPANADYREQAMVLVNHYLDMLGAHDYHQLMRKMSIKEADLKQVVELIQSLNPYPGASHSSGNTEYVVPDIIVRKKVLVSSDSADDSSSGGVEYWAVELNPEIAPKLRLNAEYIALVEANPSKKDAKYIKNNAQEARWFIKSVSSRNETLLKVAKKIVERQVAFFEYGSEAMKPMVLSDIAEEVEMHESTISRVTTQKYMLTPYGILELKYFFSSHVSTASGGECSSTAIHAIIRKLIDNENKRKPLSDNAIVKLLVEQDIQIARRTVAKYREQLHIPPSNERKRLI